MKRLPIVLMVGLAVVLFVGAPLAWGAPAAAPAKAAPAPATKPDPAATKAATPAATKAPTPAPTPPAPAPKLTIEMPPEPPPLSKTPPSDVVDLGESAKVMYKDQPTPLVTIFMMYRQANADLKYQAEKEKVVRAKLDEVQRTQSLARKELANEENPVRQEMAKLRNKERDVRKTLAEEQPKKPIPTPLPAQPAQQNNNNSSYSGSGYSGNNNNSNNAYMQWQQQVQQINQQNQQKDRKYQQDMKDYKDKQTKAKADLADLASQIKALDGKIADLDKNFDGSQVDNVAAAKTINDELQSIGRQTEVITSKLQALAEALRGAPENIRLASGIAEWETSFYAVNELKALYEDTQEEIDKVRDQLKADAEAAGRTFAADWRHPQQDRMDALKALLDKLKAARAAGAPAKAAAPAAK
jgi:predicted  nucleic acid-binding Zn-ribbon protein